jgi:hypothetical protein
VYGVDRGLDLAGPGLAAAQAAADEVLPFGDQLPVSATTVLLRQRHQRTARVHPSGPPRPGQQHQREQAVGSDATIELLNHCPSTPATGGEDSAVRGTRLGRLSRAVARC